MQRIGRLEINKSECDFSDAIDVRVTCFEDYETYCLPTFSPLRRAYHTYIIFLPKEPIRVKTIGSSHWDLLYSFFVSERTPFMTAAVFLEVGASIILKHCKRERDIGILALTWIEWYVMVFTQKFVRQLKKVAQKLNEYAQQQLFHLCLVRAF